MEGDGRRVCEEFSGAFNGLAWCCIDELDVEEVDV